MLVWLAMATILIAYRWQNIQFLILADTDDNLRLAQVKAWLAGQSWDDLRQYKLNPPEGANIHWSRLPDLPIAGLILLFKPFFGWLGAERIAIAVAPLLPFAVALTGLALVARRLVAPGAWMLAAALLFAAPSVLTMFAPTRIDHHGWQLAFLALALAGLVDQRRGRGGATLGVATAASLSVGLEMLPYLALIGGLLCLHWVIDGSQRLALRAYGVSLAAGTAVGFEVFASIANHAPRCDALTPVWLSTLLLAGGLITALSLLPAQRASVRLIIGGVAGAALAGFFLHFWPQCLTRPEGISDELYRLWFVNISEVRPLYKDNLQSAVSIAAMPIMGLIGHLIMIWRSRGRDLAWWGFFFLNLVSALMLLWQSRAAPAAQLLALPGLIGLSWFILPYLMASPYRLVRMVAVPGAFLLISGLGASFLVRWIPLEAPPTKAKAEVKAVARRASVQCATLSALRPIARLPKATIFTFVDLSPRLIAMTPHRAIAGPYHRNGEAILDVFRVFRGSAEEARPIVKAHDARYVLICPGMAEARNHLRMGPKGLLSQLQRGSAPDWLRPVPLPVNSPFMMWQVVDPDAQAARLR